MTSPRTTSYGTLCLVCGRSSNEPADFHDHGHDSPDLRTHKPDGTPRLGRDGRR